MNGGSFVKFYTILLSALKGDNYSEIVTYSKSYNLRALVHKYCKYCFGMNMNKLLFNTFAASYLNTQGLNNSCLKSPASTLVNLTFQSRALRTFSYVTCHYRRETYTAASVYLADIIFIPFIVQYAYIAI